ncbi:MAG: ShlB/FhaC/HecB family hemolysin secretion/activation protein [Alphaproteobacteria bacterium]|nr:ShlB/FhaC/HecB family hemolysin secretion/activation protein [Alphaproteobacteria bacterium]
MAMNKYFKLSLLTITGVSLVLINSVHAQVPSTADPSVIIRDFEEERRVPSRLEDTITIQDDQAKEGLSTEKIFTLNSVMLDGSTVYEQNAVGGLLAEYIGQEVSFADLNAMSVALTRKYRADGYMFSRVFLPPQEIEGGIVRLEAIEGRLTEVEVVGEFDDKLNLISDLAAKIESEGPTNSADLERYLLLIDDLPGIKARSILQQSTTPGGGKLIITIEQDNFEGSGSIDNRGSRFLGQTRGTFVAAFNSFLGIHDRTTFRGILTENTEELRFFDVAHEEQIGTEGLRLKGRFAATQTKPGWTLKPLDVKGDSHLIDLEVLYPFIRSRQYNLNLIGGFTALDSDSSILGIRVSEDKVRYLSAGGRFDFTDSFDGVTQLDLEIAKGVDWFNATSDGIGRSRSNGEHDFLRANLSAVRIQNLPGSFSMQLSGSAQYSADPLLASEEFAIGGGQFGRAFDSGEITGDRGVAGAIELRYGEPSSHDFINSYQFYGFYDIGKVWNEDPVVAEEARESLASTGVGVRFNFDHDISGYAEINTPLTSVVSAEGNDSSRLFFSLLKRF